MCVCSCGLGGQWHFGLCVGVLDSVDGEHLEKPGEHRECCLYLLSRNRGLLKSVKSLRWNNGVCVPSFASLCRLFAYMDIKASELPVLNVL